MDAIKNLFNQDKDKDKSLNEKEMPEETKTEEPAPDVRIRSAADVPSIPKDAIIDVYNVEQAISALGTFGEVVEGNHSGIVFELRDKALAKKLGIPPKFTFEWYALNFPFGAFLPNVVEATEENPVGLKWDNEAYAFYLPRFQKDRWTAGVTLVGHFTGEQYAEYVDWVAEYYKQAPGYQAYEVWDRAHFAPLQTRQFVNSVTCSTFVEESLTKMWQLGAKSDNPKQILMRSYVPLVAKNASKVDLTDPEQLENCRNFYVELNKAARGVDGESLTTSAFIRFLADRLEFFYTYDNVSDSYTRVELCAPYFALASCHQPMKLPWQTLDLMGDGNMVNLGAFKDTDDKAAGTFGEELAGAASGIGGLLKERLPIVLKDKYGDKFYFIVTAAIGTFVLAFAGLALLATKHGYKVDEFLTGSFVGFLTGFVGAKLF